MLYLHDLYSAERISIYVVKSFGQTSSLRPIKAKERCVPTHNEAYSGHGEEEMDLRLSDNVANELDVNDNNLNNLSPANLWNGGRRPPKTVQNNGEPFSSPSVASIALQPIIQL